MATRKRRTPPRSGGNTIIGIVIGLLLGAGFALAAAWFLTRGSPFQPPGEDIQRLPEPGSQQPLALPGKPGDAVQGGEYDFYRVLPQGGAAKVAPQQADPNAAASAASERLYLQVGAFEDPAEADNMKALLILNGIESSAQRARLDNGKIVHRVRIGPFSRPEEMKPVRARLAAAGFEANVVR